MHAETSSDAATFRKITSIINTVIQLYSKEARFRHELNASTA